jgi:hypothetical protein
MAIDNTPPRLKLIATIAVLTVTTLVFLDFALKTYYAYMSDEAIREKLAPPIDLTEQRKAEGEALAKANVEQVMAQMGKGPRAELITPQPSEDLGPMTGWTKMPKPAPTPQPHAAPSPAAEGDAGAATGDAGAPAPGKADAGAGGGAGAARDGGAKR